MFIGWVICFINYTFFIALLTFYLIGSKATKFRIDRKAHERNVVAASARTWTHVVCNGFVAAQHALFYYLDAGCTESLIDFSKMYNSSWWAVGVLSATACCAGDTLASELGPVLPFSQPYLITSLSPVPKGTNGGVSLAGTVASAFGGLLVGAAFYMSVIVLAVGDQSVEQTMLSQWPIMVVCGVAGILGSLIDSFLGATLQYSGVAQDGCVVECPEPGVSYISGNAILDNHSVNFLSSLITSLLVPRFAVLLWSYSHV
ncbi:transmembrane protein 19-like [Watersipora subatra]|uniref:transmembrane protein 19-like n=1 Tax=Watersipora subatra TaxID=2589382 RepID=UPI00355B827B